MTPFHRMLALITLKEWVVAHEVVWPRSCAVYPGIWFYQYKRETPKVKLQ